MKSINLIMLVLVFAVGVSLSEQSTTFDLPDDCTPPDFGQAVVLNEGSWTGIWGIVLTFRQKGNYPPIMELLLSDLKTTALVDACLDWLPSAGLSTYDAECIEKEDDVVCVITSDPYPIWMPE